MWTKILLLFCIIALYFTSFHKDPSPRVEKINESTNKTVIPLGKSLLTFHSKDEALIAFSLDFNPDHKQFLHTKAFDNFLYIGEQLTGMDEDALYHELGKALTTLKKSPHQILVDSPHFTHNGWTLHWHFHQTLNEVADSDDNDLKDLSLIGTHP